MTLPIALAGRATRTSTELGRRLLRAPERGAAPELGRRFGFGEPTGIDARPRGDRARADPRLAPRHGEATRSTALWKPGDSIQLAIGQSDLLATPLQMARFYAMIANGGGSSRRTSSQGRAAGDRAAPRRRLRRPCRRGDQASTPPRSRSSARASTRRPRFVRHVDRRVRRRSRAIAGKTGRPRSSSMPGYGRPCSTSPGGAATAPPMIPSSWSAR